MAVNPNNFTLEVYDNASGQYKAINGTAVFPCKIAQFLDKRLDEMTVTVIRDKRKVYTPATKIRVTFFDHLKVKFSMQKIFLVGSDNATEKPIASGFYTHELYLIEHTKELEGILCQTLTFTNSISKPDQIKATGNYPPTMINGLWFATENWEPVETFYTTESQIPYYNSTGAGVLKTGTSYTFQSMYDMAKNVIKASGYPDETIPFFDTSTDTIKSSIKIYSGMEIIKELTIPTGTPQDEINTIAQKTISITVPKGQITIDYNLYFGISVGDSKIARFQIAFAGSEQIYPLAPLTLLDVINRSLRLAKPLFYVGTLPQSPEYIVDPTQESFLKSVRSPEFTMTQATLREQLRLIGGYIHAEPRIIEQSNGQKWIHFDFYGSREEISIGSNIPMVTNQISQDINTYCTSVETTAQNLINQTEWAKGVVYAPNTTQYKTIRTESVNIRVTEETGLIQTQLPVYSIVQVLCGIQALEGDSTNDAGYIAGFKPTNITSFVYEQTTYFGELRSYESVPPNSRSFALYYTQSDKNIKGLFYKAVPTSVSGVVFPAYQNYAIVNILASAYGKSQKEIETALKGGAESNKEIDYSRLAFQISYVPIFHAKLSHEKSVINSADPAFQRIYNQSENTVNVAAFGTAMKSAAERMGNIEQTRTYLLPSLSYVPKLGALLDGYAISTTATEYMPFKIKCTVGLTKDFERVSRYTGLPSNKRVYEVSERESYKRDVLIKEYLIVGKMLDTAYYSERKKHLIFRYGAGLATIFRKKGTIGGNFLSDIRQISAVNCTGIPYRSVSTLPIKNTRVLNWTLLPVVATSIGNSMLFHWEYKDNYSAGEALEHITSENSTLPASVQGYWQYDYPYSDVYGNAYGYYFHLMQKVLNPTDGDTALGTREIALQLPKSSYIQPEEGTDSGVMLTGQINANTHQINDTAYILDKDSREAISFNYELEAKTNDDTLIIGNAFASSCNLVSGNSKDSDSPVMYYANPYASNLQKLDGFGGKVPSGWVIGGTITTVSVGGDSNGQVVQVKIPLRDAPDWDSVGWGLFTPIKTETITVQKRDGTGTEQITVTTGGDLIIGANETKAQQQQRHNVIYITAVDHL